MRGGNEEERDVEKVQIGSGITREEEIRKRKKERGEREDERG